MAVDWVFMEPIAEAEEQLHALVGMQLGYIFTPKIRCHGWGLAVAAQDLVLLEVDVDRVGPIAGEVGEEPALAAVLLDREAESLGEAAGTDAAIHKLAVDGPLSVEPVELEGSHEPRSIRRGRQTVERLRPGVRAPVPDGFAADLELQDQVARAGHLDCRDGFGENVGAFSVDSLILGEELA